MTNALFAKLLKSLNSKAMQSIKFRKIVTYIDIIGKEV